MDWLKGKKSYLIAILIVIYALIGAYTNQMTWDQAVGYILGAGGISALRNAIANLQ